VIKGVEDLLHSVCFTKEFIMIVHRRTWFYRMAGQKFAHSISFRIPLTAHQVREELRRTFSAAPLELWAR
jgi:hypothetical protein